MTCPNCGESEQCINELDSSIICGACGTILEDPYLISYDDNMVYRTVRPSDASIYLENEWFERTGTYFGLPFELIQAGKELYKKHRAELPKLAYNEISVGIICHIAKDLKPNWQYDDFIAAFPYPLHKPAVIKSFLRVGGVLHSVEDKVSQQFDYTIDRVYLSIAQELFPTKIPSSFTSERLKSYTRRLLKLGGQYDLNTGLKVRPLITAIACLCALHLQTKVPIKRVRKKKRISDIRSEYYHNWKFQHFSCFIFASPRYVKHIYTTYFRLIHQCVEKLSWINCDKLRNSIFFLDDVLDLFLSEGHRKPKFELDSTNFYPISYLKKTAKNDALERYIEEAKQHIVSNTRPEEPFSLTNSIITLLTAGYQEEEFIEWTPGYMRSFSNMLNFRNIFKSTINNCRDLDNPLVSGKDMSNEEVNVYLVKPI